MSSLWKESITLATAVILLPFLITSTIIPAIRQQMRLKIPDDDRFVVSHQNNGRNKEINRGAGSGTFVLGPSSRRTILRHFEPTCPFGHGISNPTPYQARRPPLGMRFTLKHNINVAFVRHVFHIIIIRSNLLAAGCKTILAICCKISFFS